MLFSRTIAKFALLLAMPVVVSCASPRVDDEYPRVQKLWDQDLAPEIQQHVDSTLVLMDTTHAPRYSSLQGYVRIAFGSHKLEKAQSSYCYFSPYSWNEDSLYLIVTTVPNDEYAEFRIHKRQLVEIANGDTLRSPSDAYRTVTIVVDSIATPTLLAPTLEHYIRYATALCPPDKSSVSKDFFDWDQDTPDSLLPVEISSLPEPYLRNPYRVNQDIVESDEYISHVYAALAVAKQRKLASYRVFHALRAIGDFKNALYMFRHIRFGYCGTGWRLPGYRLPDASELALKGEMVDFVLSMNIEILTWVPESLRRYDMTWVSVQDLQDLNIDVFALMLGSCLIVDGNGEYPLDGDAVSVGSHLAMTNEWQEHADVLASYIADDSIDMINRIVCYKVLLSLWHHVEKRQQISLDTSEQLRELLSTLPLSIQRRLSKRTKK